MPSDYLQSVQHPDLATRTYQYELANGPANFYDLSTQPQPLTLAQFSALSGVNGVNGTAADLTYASITTYQRYAGENEFRPLTGISDENGTRFATWQYDAVGRPIVSTHANGAERVDLMFNANGSVQVQNAFGSISTYNYTTQSHRKLLSSISGAPCLDCSAYQSATYNADGTASSRTDWNGRTTTYQYNGRGLETSRTEASSTGVARTISTQWHSTYRLPTQIDEPSRRTTFTHDASGNVVTKTILDTATSTSRTWSYTHNGFGQVLTANGPRTDVSDATTYTITAAARAINAVKCTRSRTRSAMSRHTTRTTRMDNH